MRKISPRRRSKNSTLNIRRCLAITAAAATLRAQRAGYAGILYDANFTTNGLAFNQAPTVYNSDADDLQTLTLDTSSFPSANSATINDLTAFGVKYTTIPAVAPVVELRFYSGVNNTPDDGVDALAGSTLLGTTLFTLPITGVAANTTYAFTIPVNLTVPTTFSLRTSFFTDSSLTTNSTNPGLASNGGPVLGKGSTGTATVGTSVQYTFLDGGFNGDHAPDGQFTDDEEVITYTNIPFNIRTAIDANLTGAPNRTWNNGSIGDGTTWNSAQSNFNNGSSTVAYNPASNGSLGGDIVTFNDSNNGHYNVSIPAVVSPTSVTVNTNSSSGYTFNGSGGVSGSGSLTKIGTGPLALNETNTYAGSTFIYGGKIILGSASALPAGTNVIIAGTNTSLVANTVGTSAYALEVGYLNIQSGGVLDLKNNALIVDKNYELGQNQDTSIQLVTKLVQTGFAGGAWNGTTGIISSTAASNHLMALGTIVNDNGNGTPLYGAGYSIAPTFAGASPADGAVLVKYTYFGDANLDGQVDGSDYTLIDHGYSNHLTGWLNGDFNYDGKIDGSDYSLIDNAFNTQGARIQSILAGSIADDTAEFAAGSVSSSVPEPAALGTLSLVTASLLRFRRRRSVSRFCASSRTI